MERIFRANNAASASSGAGRVFDKSYASVARKKCARVGRLVKTLLANTENFAPPKSEVRKATVKKVAHAKMARDYVVRQMVEIEPVALVDGVRSQPLDRVVPNLVCRFASKIKGLCGVGVVSVTGVREVVGSNPN